MSSACFCCGSCGSKPEITSGKDKVNSK